MTSTPRGAGWSATTSASTAIPARSRAWCGWPPSTTSTATRSCSPKCWIQIRRAVAERPVLEEHTLLLLRRPPDAPEISDEEAERLQGEHLAFLQRKRDEGVMAAAGPFRGQPDESWRGLCLYLVSPERALELAQDDPLVRA